MAKPRKSLRNTSIFKKGWASVGYVKDKQISVKVKHIYLKVKHISVKVKHISVGKLCSIKYND